MGGSCFVASGKLVMLYSDGPPHWTQSAHVQSAEGLHAFRNLHLEGAFEMEDPVEVWRVADTPLGGGITLRYVLRNKKEATVDKEIVGIPMGVNFRRSFDGQHYAYVSLPGGIERQVTLSDALLAREEMTAGRCVRLLEPVGGYSPIRKAPVETIHATGVIVDISTAVRRLWIATNNGPTRTARKDYYDVASVDMKDAARLYISGLTAAVFSVDGGEKRVRAAR